MSLRLSVLLVAGVFFVSCATTKSVRNGDFNITDASRDITRPAVAAAASGALAKYDFSGKPYEAEWLACKVEGATGAVLLMHRDEAAFDPKKFCDGWIAQTFLSAALNVVTVNRPGFAGSTGARDFSGAQSRAAVLAGIDAARQQGLGQTPIVGVWGYGGGASAAAFLSKKIDKLGWLVLGGGVYDAEEAAKSTRSGAIRKELKRVTGSEGPAGLADRSIAFDVEGLPKRIILYHGRSDEAVPAAQAQAFRDNLASSEYEVSLQVIDGVGHDIPGVYHRQILEVILRALGRPATR